MREFPSCFGENGVQISSHSSSTKQPSVSCLYRVVGSHLVTVTWQKNIMGQTLTLDIVDASTFCRLEVRPWDLWKKKGKGKGKGKGEKSFHVGTLKANLLWDLSSAKYGLGPEPLEGYFVAIVADCGLLLLLLGDLWKEPLKRPAPAALVLRKEQLFGRRSYATRVCLAGPTAPAHDISIECHAGGQDGPRLCIRVDRQLVICVAPLTWKFRGNETILVDGIPVQVLWDAHNWLFCPHESYAIFLFQTSSPVPNRSKLTQEEKKVKEEGELPQAQGFSLLLYAWKCE